MGSIRLRAHIAWAVILLAAASPAAGDETAYLMYVKGSEGPPAQASAYLILSHPRTLPLSHR